jgi:hypothetical protein
MQQSMNKINMEKSILKANYVCSRELMNGLSGGRKTANEKI